MQTMGVKTSKIHRRGLFAEKDMKKGEVLFKVEGPVIRYAFEPDYRAGANWLQIRKNVWKMPLRSSLWNFVNHSCHPNAGLRGTCTVVAMKDIRSGDEITIDYSTVEAGSRWRMNCRCGMLGCRKIIRSIRFLPQKVFLSYLPFVPVFLCREYFQEKTYKYQKIGQRKLFAKHPIQKDEVICAVEGPIIKYSFEPDYRIGYQWLAMGKNTWMIPLRSNPWNFIRHSCEPNVGVNDGPELIAMRNIKPGEELVIDDSMTECDVRWKQVCHCGAKTCRGVVRSIQFLDSGRFKRYKSYLPQFIQQAYREQQ